MDLITFKTEQNRLSLLLLGSILLWLFWIQEVSFANTTSNVKTIMPAEQVNALIETLIGTQYGMNITQRSMHKDTKGNYYGGYVAKNENYEAEVTFSFENANAGLVNGEIKAKVKTKKKEINNQDLISFDLKQDEKGKWKGTYWLEDQLKKPESNVKKQDVKSKSSKPSAKPIPQTVMDQAQEAYEKVLRTTDNVQVGAGSKPSKMGADKGNSNILDGVAKAEIERAKKAAKGVWVSFFGR